MPKREAIFPANRHALYDEHRYSAAIRSGDLLFVSGQVGSRDDGSPEPDFNNQVRLAFANLKAVLAAAGCTFDDVVDVTTFHTDPETQFEPFIFPGLVQLNLGPKLNKTYTSTNTKTRHRLVQILESFLED